MQVRLCAAQVSYQACRARRAGAARAAIGVRALGWAHGGRRGIVFTLPLMASPAAPAMSVVACGVQLWPLWGRRRLVALVGGGWRAPGTARAGWVALGDRAGRG